METKLPEISGALLALSNDLAAAVERAGRAVVAIHARQRIPSSGVQWKQGMIVTAEHTLKRHEDISVTLPDGRTVPAALAGRDPSTDLAVLKLQSANELPTADIGDASTLRIGHVVLAVGRAGELSASWGVISALGAAWRTWRGGQIDRFVRLDAAIYDGFSGGPLVNAQGQVVGINTSGLSRRAAVTIPASTVERVARELVEKGHIARGYLGLGMQPVPLPEALKSRLDLTGKAGLIVVSVEPNGPAEKAGLLIGDVLVALEGKPLSDLVDLQAILSAERVGKPLQVSVVRGGTLRDVTITVGERPQREE